MTNTLPALVSQPDLAALTAIVRKEHEAAVLGMSCALEHAIAAGEALLKAKAVLKQQGQPWLPWLERQCSGDFSVRMAQNYMTIAAGRATLAANTKRVSYLSIRGALKLLRQESNPSVAKAPQGKPKPKKAATSFDALGWWTNASLEERRYFIDGVGRRGLLEAAPASWRLQRTPEIEHIIEDASTNPVTATDNTADDGDGLDVSEFLMEAARRRWPERAAEPDKGAPTENLKPAPVPSPPPPVPPPLPVFDAERLAKLEAEIGELQRTAVQRHLAPRELRRLDRLRKERDALGKPESLAHYLDRQAAAP
jgi:hypothetical protein